MQISPEQGQFMQLLIKVMNAKNTIEIGVFTGYSSLCVALALPVDGKIIACDISTKYTDIAEKYWEDAKVRNKIDLKIGPAIDSLKKLIDKGMSNTFDFSFLSISFKTRLLSSAKVAVKILSFRVSSLDPFGPVNVNFPPSVLTLVSLGMCMGFFPSFDIIIRKLYKLFLLQYFDFLHHYLTLYLSM